VQSYKIREREKASAREKSGRPAVLDTSGMGEAEREQATQEMNDARMDERDEAGRRVHNFLRQVEAKMVTHDLWKAASWGGGEGTAGDGFGNGGNGMGGGGTGEGGGTAEEEAEAELDNLREGLEKFVLGKLYSVNFAPKVSENHLEMIGILVCSVHSVCFIYSSTIAKTRALNDEINIRDSITSKLW
jgi:hypothetical protein